jgi:hypothetical protein
MYYSTMKSGTSESAFYSKISAGHFSVPPEPSNRRFLRGILDALEMSVDMLTDIHVKCSLCSILTTSEMASRRLVKSSNIKLHENPFNCM